MIRSALSRVAWVGRTASTVFGLALVLALVVGVASMAFGANGQAWILGQPNVATAITRLAGAAGVNGPMLQLINNNPAANDTALDLRVQAGEAPLTVNSPTKVTNLNADKVDGQSLECPSGTLFHEGVCIETSKRGSATFDQAEGDCLDEGNRLATIAELQTFRTRSGHDFATAEWSNEVEMFSSTFRVATTIIPSSGSRLYSVGEQDYRCVRQPL